MHLGVDAIYRIVYSLGRMSKEATTEGNMNDLFNTEHRTLIAARGQLGRLYRLLVQGEKVTSLDAWRQIGIARLASRVHDLKEHGVDVRSEWIEVSNQYGETCRVKQYYLEVQG